MYTYIGQRVRMLPSAAHHLYYRVVRLCAGCRRAHAGGGRSELVQAVYWIGPRPANEKAGHEKWLRDTTENCNANGQRKHGGPKTKTKKNTDTVRLLFSGLILVRCNGNI